MSKLKVALISPICRINDVPANLAHFTRWISKAKGKGARFIGFPEMALSGYAQDPGILNAAEPVPGPTTEELEAIAKRFDVYLSIGMLESAGQKYFNPQVFIGPGGYIGHYSKHYPTKMEQQALGISPGTKYPTFMLDNIRFGINICMDSRYADTNEALAEQGVQLVHTPHSNNKTLGQHAEIWTRGKIAYYLNRIWHSRTHILINNMAGSAKGTTGRIFSYSSGALILDPLGQVAARTTQQDNEEKMLVTTIDTDITKYIPEFEAKRPYLESIRRVREDMGS